MGLDSWVAVVLFLFFIAPGLLYDLLAEKRFVRPTESTLRETGRIALASIVFTAISSTVVLLVGSLGDDWLPVWRDLFSGPGTYFANHYGRVLGTLVAEVFVALGLVYVMHHHLMRNVETPLKQISPWRQVFKDERPPDKEVQVCVELANGDRVVGKLAWYTPNLTTEDRELILAPPIYVQRRGAVAQKSDPLWERVVIHSDQIVRLDVAYVPWSGPAPDGPAAV